MVTPNNSQDREIYICPYFLVHFTPPFSGRMNCSENGVPAWSKVRWVSQWVLKWCVPHCTEWNDADELIASSSSSLPSYCITDNAENLLMVDHGMLVQLLSYRYCFYCSWHFLLTNFLTKFYFFSLVDNIVSSSSGDRCNFPIIRL